MPRSIYSLWSQGCLDHRVPCPARRPTYVLSQQNVVGEVAHVEAVRDRVNVPFWVVQIRAAMGKQAASLDGLISQPGCASEMCRPCRFVRAYPDNPGRHRSQRDFPARRGGDGCCL